MQNLNEKVLFVDCFNTIIGRTKSPDDVLFDWAHKMNQIYKPISQENFFKIFKGIWADCVRVDTLETEKSEFLTNIDRMFLSFANIIKKYNMIQPFDETKFLEDCFLNYYIAEKESHFLKKKTYSYLLKQKALGKKIYVVSDFYCSKQTIIEWLKNIGVEVDNLFTDVFVSCDLKKSKEAGSIYPYLLGLLNLQPKQVTMMGDNLIVDTINAKKHGLKTKSVAPCLQVRSKELRQIKRKPEIPQTFLDIFNDNKNTTIYSNYAFSLYLFTKRLAEHIERKQIRNVFFLAREGKLLKDLFDEYIKFHNLDIKTHYFVTSRKSIMNATLSNFKQSFEPLVSKCFISVNGFLTTLNFPQDKIDELCTKLKIKPKMLHINLEKSNAYKKLIQCDEFKKYYNKFRIKQYVSFTNYINTFDVDIKKEGFFLVDSGWHSSIQKYFSTYFNGAVDVSGCYLGCMNKGTEKMKAYGLLFSTKQKLGKTSKMFEYRFLNYENLLRTEEPSCMSYNVATGNPSLDAYSKENEITLKYVIDVQNKIVEKFKRIMQEDSSKYYPTDTICTSLYYRMIQKTTMKDRNWYDRLQETYYDTFGYTGFTNKNFTKFFRKLTFIIRDNIFKVKYKFFVSKKRYFFK